MRSVVLQDWLKVSGQSPNVGRFTQPQGGWLDLSSFASATFWIDVADVVQVSGGNVGLILQTSPTLDESYFKPVAPIINSLVAATTPQILQTVRTPSTVPLARYLRWQLFTGTPDSAASWGATIRIRVAPALETFFVPTDIRGCALWLRSDLDVSLTSSQVQTWNDQSGNGDANRNLTSGGSTNRPGFQATGGPNGTPALVLSSTAPGTYMTSGLWSSVLAQPSIWLIVANNTSAGTSTQYLMDGNDPNNGQAVQYTPSSTTPTLTLFAGGSSSGITANWSNPNPLLALYNGASSGIYFNKFTTGQPASVTAANGGQGSMTFGMHSHQFGGGSNWDGKVSEVIAYSRPAGNPFLTLTERARLRNYINARYAFGVL